jgi:predicted MFS family arabinose efflux permease
VFQAPLRLLLTLRPKIPLGVLVATAVSTVVFASTPFLVKGVADDFDVAVGQVGIISTAQLAGFTLASWGAGRFLRPRRRMMVIAVLLGAAANLLSAMTPWFSTLLALRFASGISLGLIAWIAWAEVFGDDDKTGDVAVIGPIVGTLASPLVAAVIDQEGVDALFGLLSVLYLVPLAFIGTTKFQAVQRPRGGRHRPTRAAAAILACLSLMTLGGSAVFVFAGVIGQDDVGLTALAVSLVFSANAIAGVPSARYRGRRRLPGFWILVTAMCAIAVPVWHHPAVFWIALPLWGFSFWMATPGAFSLLAERSRYPSERAGDAQAVMAAGRVIGPLVGGAAYAVSPALLGVVGGGVMAVAAIAMLYIEWRIHPESLTDLVSLS